MFPQTLAHGNSKNEIRQTDEEGTKRGVSIERSKAGTKKKVLIKISPNQNPNQNIIIINKIVKSFKDKEKHNEIQLTKNKMNLNNRNMTNHSPSSDFKSKCKNTFSAVEAKT